jgi:ABC-type nitrate/sulfonate/bicarbonate transport system permease component
MRHLESEPTVRAGVAVWSRLTHGVMLFVAILALMSLTIPDYLSPRPSEVLSRVLCDWRSMVAHSQHNLIEILVGFAASIIVACLPFAIVLSRTLERIVMPMMVAAGRDARIRRPRRRSAPLPTIVGRI